MIFPQLDTFISVERNLLEGYAAARRGQREAARRNVAALTDSLPKFRVLGAGRGPLLEQSFQNLRAEVLPNGFGDA
jgi:hypothetical protein